jgi:CRP/FNR family transcriptional regulator
MALDASPRGQSTGALRTVAAGEPLFRASTPAHSIFAIRQGMIKSVRVSVDGEETILAIHTPGELLGLEAFGVRRYAYDAIALQPVVCCELSVPVLSEQSSRVRELGAALFRLLGRAAEPRLPAARGSVRQRVTAFLLDLAQRLERHGLDSQRFSVGLSRQELANLLDARIETISRMIQRLNRERGIRIQGATVTVLSLAPESQS